MSLAELGNAATRLKSAEFHVSGVTVIREIH